MPPAAPISLRDLTLYFLKLGTIGFGGPAALVGYMRRDLVDKRKAIDEPTYNLSIALAQVMPGPLAAQTAIAIGYFHHGILGATLVGLAFILPSFCMVIGLSALYVEYGGLPWMQALFYGIGAVIIPIIGFAAYRLARGTNKRDPLLWCIFAALFAATVVTRAEIAVLFIVAGLVAVIANAWPGLRTATLIGAACVLGAVVIVALEQFLVTADAVGKDSNELLQILLFFTKAGAFVFGSGLAIVPFLEQGVVHDLGWLTEQEFLDAVAVALITPGPVVITVAFIGYLESSSTRFSSAARSQSLATWPANGAPLAGPRSGRAHTSATSLLDGRRRAAGHSAPSAAAASLLAPRIATRPGGSRKPPPPASPAVPQK